MSLDVSTDFLNFDAGATITLTQYRGGTDTEKTIRNVTTGPLGYKQVQALQGVSLTGGERSFSLNNVDVGSAGVQQGDTLDDGTNEWEVLMSDLATMGTRWRCAARMIPK